MKLFLFPTALSNSVLSLDQLEREEEEYEAKMKGIAEIQATLPIGVTPAILGRYEKKVKEIRENADDKPSVQVLFWNRQQQSNVPITTNESPTPPQPMTPVSSRRPDSEFSFALSTPRSMAFNTPQRTPQSVRSMVSRDSSYNLDSSTDDTIQFDTPRSHISPAGSGAGDR